MDKHEQLVQAIRESASLEERLASCRERIGKMCRERRPPKMTIPVHWNDDDVFISTTIHDAMVALFGEHDVIDKEIAAMSQDEVVKAIEESAGMWVDRDDLDKLMGR